MPRAARVDVGDQIYHILNRANARVSIFDTAEDYEVFEDILEQAIGRFDMRLLAYCLMPNHWHLVVFPQKDGDLGRFMGWLTNTHTRRWHTARNTVGEGHLYQGRYKSFICKDDDHFLTLCRYVERNAKKADLCDLAQNWKWSSVWRRTYGSDSKKKILAPWIIEPSKDYLSWLNEPQTAGEEEAIERSVLKSRPFGDWDWVHEMVKKFNLEQTMTRVGRPRNGG
jgi:putative transposase